MVGIALIFFIYFRIVEHNLELQKQIIDNSPIIPIAQLLAYEGYFGYIILKLIPMYQEKRKIKRDLPNVATLVGIVVHKYVIWVVDLIGITITFYSFFIYAVPHPISKIFGIMDISDLYFLVIVPSLGLLSHYLISKRKLQYRKVEIQTIPPNSQDVNVKRTLKKHHIHLILGVLIIGIGVLIFWIPISNDRLEVDRWEGFSSLRHENVTLSSLQFNIVTLEKTQTLHIFYATNEIHSNTNSTFLMFFIPYMGNLEANDKYSIPYNWETKRIPELHTTIIYKFFDCTTKDPCRDQLNMYFDFDKKIDAKQYYIHSINVPFSTPLHPEVLAVRDEILKNVSSGYWKGDWGLDNKTNLELSVSVLDDSTQYNLIPDGYLKSHKYEKTGVTNSVVVWKIPDHPIDFHLDYVDPAQKFYYDVFVTLSVIMFGTGTAFLTIAFSEWLSARKIIKNELS